MSSPEYFTSLQIVFVERCYLTELSKMVDCVPFLL